MREEYPPDVTAAGEKGFPEFGGFSGRNGRKVPHRRASARTGGRPASPRRPATPGNRPSRGSRPAADSRDSVPAAERTGRRTRRRPGASAARPHPGSCRPGSICPGRTGCRSRIRAGTTGCAPPAPAGISPLRRGGRGGCPRREACCPPSARTGGRAARRPTSSHAGWRHR